MHAMLQTCTIDLPTCFPNLFNKTSTEPISATSMFKTITFAKPYCGDCLIDALVTLSGRRGLSAFLPEEKMIFHPRQDTEGENGEDAKWRREEPMLPLVSKWEEGEFGLESVVWPGQDIWEGVKRRKDGGVGVRDWCIKLLSRYTYIYGKSSASPYS
jgi:3-O-alpha-D-mannopyranosyl-alpha-D-mannopyranose xylosylphosphotransferase